MTLVCVEVDPDGSIPSRSTGPLPWGFAMRVYVAAKFELKNEVRDVYKTLRDAGHVVTFDWTSYEDTPLREKGLETALAAYRTKCSLLDMDGVRSADVLFLFPGNGLGGTGRFWEAGGAAVLKKNIIVVGKPDYDSVFHYLPYVEIVEDLPAAMASLFRLQHEWDSAHAAEPDLEATARYIRETAK